jgi:hypothetical protein
VLVRPILESSIPVIVGGFEETKIVVDPSHSVGEGIVFVLSINSWFSNPGPNVVLKDLVTGENVRHLGGKFLDLGTHIVGNFLEQGGCCFRENHIVMSEL